MKKKASLVEIAKMANVSPAMVSQVLNGKGRASEQVLQKILTLLEENEYLPKYARRPFYYIIDLPRIEASGKTQNILEQLSGIQQVFDDQHLTLHVEFIRTEPAFEQLNRIIQRKPGGVIVNTDAPFLDEACHLFQTAKIPLVQIGYDTQNSKYNAVVMDGFSGAYAATRYLLNRGHKRIAILRWLAGLAAVNSNKKYAGYLTALSDAGIATDNSLIKAFSTVPGEPDWQPIRKMVEELIVLPDPPTAVFIDNSFVSLSLLYPHVDDKGKIPDCIRRLEIVLFEDWALQPVHDILSNKLFYPELDTIVVNIDWERIGRQAAHLLIEEAGHFSLVPKLLHISPMLYRVQGGRREFIIENERN